MIFTASIPSLLHRWEVAEYISEGFVILGCAGELVADLATCLPRKQRKHIERWSTILLVIALSVSLKCLVRTNELSGYVIGSLGKEANEADTKARKALDDSARAITQSGKATTRADALTTRMGSASRKLDDLERDILAEGPRWRLLHNGESTFVKTLKPFAGQRVTVVSCANDDTERFGFEETLLNAFPKAGWNAPGYRRWEQCPTMLTGGNQIFFVSSPGSAYKGWLKPACLASDQSSAANALCHVLNKLKIFTHGWEEKPVPEAIPNATVFFGEGSPGVMALENPSTIFLLIGPNAPVFANKDKHPAKK